MLHFVERNDSVHLRITLLVRFPSFLTLSFEVFSLEANQTLSIRYRSEVIESLMQKLSTKLSTNEVYVDIEETKTTNYLLWSVPIINTVYARHLFTGYRLSATVSVKLKPPLFLSS